MRKLLIVLAVLLLASPLAVYAVKPDPNVPNPPLQVLEYNVDANGWIAVHEQGTASVDIVDTEELDVNITNAELDVNITNPKLTVDVDNFPAEQDVYVTAGALSAVTSAEVVTWHLEPKEVREITFSNPILATTIQFRRGSDEGTVAFFSPLVSGDTVLSYYDPDGSVPWVTESFTYPIPISGIYALCGNESDNCIFKITIFGDPM